MNIDFQGLIPFPKPPFLKEYWYLQKKKKKNRIEEAAA
jgi:hypothetical protein